MVTMHDVLDAQWMLDNAKDGGCPVLGGLHAVGALCWGDCMRWVPCAGGTACGGCPVLGGPHAVGALCWGNCMRWVPCAGGTACSGQLYVPTT